MKLFEMMVQLQEDLHLGSSDDHTQLRKDVKKWQDDASTTDEPNKLEQLYIKLHKGIMFRLGSSILYVFLFRWVKQQLTFTDEDEKDKRIYD